MSRRRGSSIELFSNRNSFLRFISNKMADSYVAAGARRSPDGKQVFLTSKDATRLPIASTISRFEMEANAGLHGAPRLDLGDADPVFRAMEKIRLWGEVHDTFAVCISAGRVIQPANLSQLTEEQLNQSFVL